MTNLTYMAYVWLYDGPGFSFWWILPLFFGAIWLVFIGLLIWKLIWLRTWGRDGSRSDATALLRERFARGEINAEEYESRRQTLKGR